MTEQEKIERYKQIIYRLSVINNLIKDLNYDVSLLLKNCEDAIMIDGAAYCANNIRDINNKLNSSYGIIERNIIPSLLRKTYN